jgi:hypothetical protein
MVVCDMVGFGSAGTGMAVLGKAVSVMARQDRAWSGEVRNGVMRHRLSRRAWVW